MWSQCLCVCQGSSAQQVRSDQIVVCPGPGTSSSSSMRKHVGALGHEGGYDRLLVGLGPQEDTRLLADAYRPLPQAGEREVEVAAFCVGRYPVALGPLAVAGAQIRISCAYASSVVAPWHRDDAATAPSAVRRRSVSRRLC